MVECEHNNRRHFPGATTTAGEYVDLDTVCVDCGAMRMWGIGWLPAFDLDESSKKFIADVIAHDHCGCNECEFDRIMEEHRKEERHDPAGCQVCKDYGFTEEDMNDTFLTRSNPQEDSDDADTKDS